MMLPRVLDEQHPRNPVIIPIITRNSQIRDIFTEIRTAQLSPNPILLLEIQWALSPHPVLE